MPSYQLNDNHPTMQKLRQLEDLARELGLSLQFTRSYPIFVADGKNRYRLVDTDSGHTVTEFPAFSEYKLTHDKK